MNVFLVDAGKLFSLDACHISKRVCDLQSTLSDLADIPIDKQVGFNYINNLFDINLLKNIKMHIIIKILMKNMVYFYSSSIDIWTTRLPLSVFIPPLYF